MSGRFDYYTNDDRDLASLANDAADAQARIRWWERYGALVEKPDEVEFALVAEWKRRFQERMQSGG